MGKLMIDYFVLRGGTVRGPASAAKLREMAAAGKLRKDDGIRRGEDGDWIVAGTISGLFDSAGGPETEGELIKGPLANLAERAGGMIVTTAGTVGRAAVNMGGTVKDAITRRNEKVATQPANQPPAMRPLQTVRIPAAQTELLAPAQIDEDTTVCPFCSETIKRSAKKCKHCGEILDVVLRQIHQSAAGHAVMAPAGPAPVINITNVNTATVGADSRRGAAWSPLVAALLSFLIPGLGQLYKGQLLNGVVWFFVVLVGYGLLVVPGLILHICCVCGAAMGDPYR